MARGISAFSSAALWLCGTLFLASLPLLRGAQRQEDTLYMWIDAHQARVLIGFEEDILIVSEGKMAPFTHDFRKAQQRMPAIPINIQSINFTWQATGKLQQMAGT
ncbi:wnt inhibitory factor 1 [Crotalus adamanteus]|uniref:Wnt inhibitory factor 1 n=1 Tax=Crotalus adamanteus TaxID=8729 RepID=A0AAW1BD14_CROAD